jgi:hypothetical protein
MRDMWICNSVHYHFVKWGSAQNKSCRSWWVLQLWYSWLFQLKPFRVSKLSFKYNFLKFKVSNCQTLSNSEMPKIKVVDLDEIYNFGIHDFSNWNLLGFQNLVSSSNFFKIQSFKLSNFIKFKNAHSKSCRPWWDLQLLYLWGFQLKPFSLPKLGFNLSYLFFINNYNFFF